VFVLRLFGRALRSIGIQGHNCGSHFGRMGSKRYWGRECVEVFWGSALLWHWVQFGARLRGVNVVFCFLGALLPVRLGFGCVGRVIMAVLFLVRCVGCGFEKL